MDSIDSALQDIQATEDLLEKALKLAGLVTGVFDWDEVERLAALPSFSVAEQMAGLKAEVERELG